MTAVGKMALTPLQGKMGIVDVNVERLRCLRSGKAG